MLTTRCSNLLMTVATVITVALMVGLQGCAGGLLSKSDHENVVKVVKQGTDAWCVDPYVVRSTVIRPQVDVATGAWNGGALARIYCPLDPDYPPKPVPAATTTPTTPPEPVKRE